MDLSLSLLGQEYDVLLTKYQQAYTNYTNYISSSFSSSSSDYATLQGNTFWGTGAVGGQTSTTVEDCQGLCSSISNCTGATFNPDKKYCWARTGEGDVIPGLDNDVAIVPKVKQYSNVLSNINSQLLALNKKMIDLSESSKPELEKETQTRDEMNKQLMLNYENLMDEKQRIDNLIREYESIEDINKNSYISVNQKYSSYIAISLFFVVIIIIFLFMLF